MNNKESISATKKKNLEYLTNFFIYLLILATANYQNRNVFPERFRWLMKARLDRPSEIWHNINAITFSKVSSKREREPVRQGETHTSALDIMIHYYKYSTLLSPSPQELAARLKEVFITVLTPWSIATSPLAPSPHCRLNEVRNLWRTSKEHLRNLWWTSEERLSRGCTRRRLNVTC